jgi:hypothetical protein
MGANRILVQKEPYIDLDWSYFQIWVWWVSSDKAEIWRCPQNYKEVDTHAAPLFQSGGKESLELDIY